MRRPRPIPLISITVIVVALTVAVVVSVRRNRTRVLSDTISEPAPEEGPRQHRLLPNVEGATMVVPDRPHSAHEMRGRGHLEGIGRRREFKVNTNSLGLRGPEVAVPATGYRIMCTGDSVTFGWGVEYEDSWPAQLSRELGVDTVNAAWPGAQPDRMCRYASEQARPLDVDLVLLCWGPFSGGEPLQAVIKQVRETAAAIAPIPLGWVIPPPGTFDPLGVHNAREVYPRLAELIPDIPVFDVTPAFRAALPLPGVVGEMDGDLQRMIKLPEGTVLVEAVGAPNSIAPEIVAKFEADPTLKEPLFFDEGHPDAEGFTLFASEVAGWVRSQGWVE
ncbi:MAG: SGNH/GDSL hydrolase family protein [Myxococcota bacterium]|jgi:lysophospholipase L1-like esterase|nr:SGNH/GDSL hydrolase family protein [Myxococcota bacterium]